MEPVINTPHALHHFNHCGLAALSDLQTPEWRELFAYLEQEQTAFLALEDKFRSPEYPWPRKPLHTWSRVWEYPFVYHHLQDFRGRCGNAPTPIVDLGSGVTFFPFAVARLGYQVICVDLDPVCERDLSQAAQWVHPEPGQVDFRLTDGVTLPCSDCEVDLIYCISVLEHIPSWEKTIAEMARILKPSGLLLLTLDLDLRGDAEVGVEKYRQIANTLKRYFKEFYPQRTIHPADLLHSAAGPFGHEPPRGVDRLWFIIKQQIIKPLLGRKPAPMLPFHLAVTGVVMEKV